MKSILSVVTGLCLLLQAPIVLAQNEAEPSDVAASGESISADSVLVAPAAAQPLAVPPLPGAGTFPGGEVVIDTVPSLLAPAHFRMSQRRSNRIGLQWQDRTDLEDSVEVLRSDTQALGDPIATFGPQTGFNSFVDTNVEPDTRYCYRIRVTKGEAWKVTKPLCIYTKDATDLFLFGAQVQIKVANRDNADTNDPVAVRLNSPRGFGFRPSGNETWLNHGHDDFERGSTFTYDLLIPGRLSDITGVSLIKDGTDGLCVESLKLTLNVTDDDPGFTVLDRDFSTESAGCHWVDDDDGHESVLSFSHSELRQSSQWPASEGQWCGSKQNCVASIFPMQLSTLEHRLEGAIGHLLHFTDKADWPPQPAVGLPPPRRVKLSVVDYRTARIRIQVRGEAPILPDPNVVMTGNILIVPSETDDGARLSLNLDSVNANVDFNILVDALGYAGGALIGSESCPNLIDCLERYIEGSIEGSFAPISEGFEFPGTGGLCPLLKMDDRAGEERVVVASPLPLCTDFDRDNMPNAWENDNNLDRYDGSDKDEDPDGDGATNLEEFEAGTDPHCPWVPGDDNFCRDCGPCVAGVGGCLLDNQCTGGLVCSEDVGQNYGLPASTNVCECPWDENDGNYCRDCGPCERGGSDCDSDAECLGELICSHDVGANYGLDPQHDVCECGPELTSQYCSECGPCKFGQGDCDSDAECGDGLVCADNVGASFGMPEDWDMCVCAPGVLCNPASENAPLGLSGPTD